MVRSGLQARSPLLVAGFGAVLFLSAVGYHATEFLNVDGSLGPPLALLLDGVPALGIVYGGYRLSKSEFGPELRWLVCVWCFIGVGLLVAVVQATILVRVIENREVAEPVFPILVASGSGGVAGIVAGYYNARARLETRQARAVSEAFAFVNDLIRHDLRNDLNLIRGRAELLAAETGDDGSGDTSDIVETTDEALVRIKTTDAVADTLLGDPHLESVDLVTVAAEMTARLDGSSAAEITTDFPEHAHVVANAGIRSVVDNILENAVQHNDAEDPAVHTTSQLPHPTRLRRVEVGLVRELGLEPVGVGGESAARRHRS